ncbi:hypothetical protein Tco_0869953 [Tanacetum coccineum]
MDDELSSLAMLTSAFLCLRNKGWSINPYGLVKRDEGLRWWKDWSKGWYSGSLKSLECGDRNGLNVMGQVLELSKLFQDFPPSHKSGGGGRFELLGGKSSKEFK